ncbi:MAG TPA: bifunctional phosphopantothenoylcysteine decarboxylase/phosphopantothenate--cysteine ligase CoaBC [Candidatus Saccharimonadales bacterium]|jgi:phosphopantothenoylcysteine decarboxylase/phosphopantothenate--cysteine ligase|nr:bifunctional phosphopantothenoylcysteine decarboxylase/phosphopantothenate--cysteine ligase CoaBC [Candidatus Saccharimonadales bacterium]
MNEILRGKYVVLAVSGSIAVYKVIELARRMTQAGATVQVIMTPGATQFVQPLTFQALTYRPVEVEMFGTFDDRATGHVAMGQQADVVVVAPATAHTIARLANGFADDLIGTTVLASHAPLVIAPAMETHMWSNPATQANVDALRDRGASIVEPESGELASGLMGQGRLASIEAIGAAIEEALSTSTALAGRRVIVTAGPTLEPIDPVRVVTNRSSGKMGYAVAAAAQRAGARVTLVSGPSALRAPAGVTIVAIETAQELSDAVLAALPGADAVIMAAAIADYRPASPADRKLKKRDQGDTMSLDLTRTADVLQAIVAKRDPRTIVVGFKAETGDALAEASRMLREKKLDLVVANDVTAKGSEFGSDTDQVTLVSADGAEALPLLTKREVARRLVAKIAERLAS